MKNNQVLILDADIPLFRSASKAQSSMVIDGIVFSFAQTVDQERMYDSYIEMIREKTGIKDVVMAITDRSGNFRKEIYPEYKAQRTYQPKPIGYKELLAYIEEEYGTISSPMIEADDVLGILGSQGRFKGKEVVILSDDKDLLTIPCKYVDTKDDFKIKQQSKLDADRFWMLQALMGDATDNYKGCPKYGPKTAEKLLQKIEDAYEGDDPEELFNLWWDAVVAAFIKAGLTEEEALVQARLARILRVEDWDKKNQQVKLWKPQI